MQLTLTRGEIREQMRSLMGQQTTEFVSGISYNQFNAFIDRAYVKALSDSPWVSTEFRTTVDCGIAQHLLAYPADCQPGSIVEMAIADPADGVYQTMDSRRFPVAMDFDLIEALGGDDYTAIQGTPRWWQQRGDGIFLYPPNDTTARKVRILAQRIKRLTDDGQSTLCDGELVIYWGLALAYGDHDPAQRVFYQGSYADRKGTLCAWQHTNEAVTFRDDSPTVDYQNANRPVPNWDLRPYVPGP